MGTTDLDDDTIFAGKKTRKVPLKLQEEWWVTLLEYLRQDVMDGNIEDHIIKRKYFSLISHISTQSMEQRSTSGIC